MGEKSSEGQHFDLSQHFDLGQQVDFWSWMGLAGRPIDVNAGEAPCSMMSLEMLQYPRRSQPVCDDGIIEGDEGVSEWLGKVRYPTFGMNGWSLSCCRAGFKKNVERCTIRPAKCWAADFVSFYLPKTGSRSNGKARFGVAYPDSSTQRMILPFGDKAYTSVKEKLGLPDDFRNLLAKKGSRSLEYTPEIDGKTLQCPPSQGLPRNELTLLGFIYKFVLHEPAYYHLVLSYDKSTRLTHGLLLAVTTNHEFSGLINGLKSRKTYCGQPLLLANLVAEFVAESCARQIDFSDTELNKLEEDMGQHKYINRRIRNPFEMDFKGATQTLNFISRRLSLDVSRLGGNCLTLKKILQDTRGIVDERLVELQDEGHDEKLMNLKRGLQMMKKMEAYLINYSKNQELRALYEEKRARTQSAAVRDYSWSCGL
jgi:hypothetical protein